MRSKEERAATKAQRQADHAQAKSQRQAARQERLEKFRANQARIKELAERTVWLPGLGVSIRDGTVRASKGADIMGITRARNELAIQLEERPGGSTDLGPLAGARADVISGHVGHRRTAGTRTADATLATVALSPVLGPLAVAGGALAGGFSRVGTQGVAFVIFPTGKMHEKPVNSPQDVLSAQTDAVRFNALAQAAEQEAGGAGESSAGQNSN